MELGNSYIGIDIHSDYLSLRLFPIAIEVFIFVGNIEASITLWPIEITFATVFNLNTFR